MSVSRKMLLDDKKPDLLLSSYHPLLPTTAEAKVDKSLVFSDHLPLKTEFVFGDQTLKMITWNVCIPNLASGFDMHETKSQAAQREKRTIDAILKLISDVKPDVILLQEVYFDLNRFREILFIYSWKIADEKGAVVTIYNASKLKKISFKELNPDPNLIYTIAKSIFKFIPAKKMADNKQEKQTLVAINNVHFPHDDCPRPAEKFLRYLLSSDHSSFANVVVGGDFNNRYATLGKTFLPNNVVSSRFRDDIGIQGVDFTDGFFVMDGKDKEIHQPAKTETLDPQTGKTFVNTELDKKKLHNDQINELNRQRLFITISVDHAFNFKFDPDKTGIDVHQTINAFNKKMIEIKMLDEEKNKGKNAAIVDYKVNKALLEKAKNSDQFKEYVILILLVHIIKSAKSDYTFHHAGKDDLRHRLFHDQEKGQKAVQDLLVHVVNAEMKESLMELLKSLIVHFNRDGKALGEFSLDTYILNAMRKNAVLIEYFSIVPKMELKDLRKLILKKCEKEVAVPLKDFKP